MHPGAVPRISAASPREFNVFVSPTISIIDDDEEVRVATENLVLSLGLEAQTFPSAESFLEHADTDTVDCLITDVQMPGMTGVELQGVLRARGVKVPMIFITAFPEERVRREAEAGGAIGFLTKPFDGGALIACIDEALRASRGDERAEA